MASLDLVEVDSEVEPTVIGAFETNAEPALAPTWMMVDSVAGTTISMREAVPEHVAAMVPANFNWYGS
jgi:hypothetical protein